MAEDGGHGGGERGAKFELVGAEEAPVRVHESVVVHHGGHEAAGEGVAVDERDDGHGVAAFLGLHVSEEVRTVGKLYVKSLCHSGYKVWAKNPLVFTADS